MGLFILLYQIPIKRDCVSIYRVILLQHWTTFIQPIYHTVFCAFFKAISIPYRYYYDFITGLYGKTCEWVFVFIVCQCGYDKLVRMRGLGFKPSNTKLFRRISTSCFGLSTNRIR